jgi:hypothetical protein
MRVASSRGGLRAIPPRAWSLGRSGNARGSPRPGAAWEQFLLALGRSGTQEMLAGRLVQGPAFKQFLLVPSPSDAQELPAIGLI